MTIALLTDFGLAGPYTGQMQAVLMRDAPGVPVVSLFADLPRFSPQPAAYLLPAYCRAPFATGTVFLAVVDPGVGTERAAVVVWADGYWFVGPDNGLFALTCRRAERVRAWRIDWRPQTLSASFHGRDLFAPVAAKLCGLDGSTCSALPFDSTVIAPQTLDRLDWPDDLWSVVYIDHYGNAILGVRPQPLAARTRLRVAGEIAQWGQTFGAIPPGGLLSYTNSNGLLEIAVNGGSAAAHLGLTVGEAVEILDQESG
jgi:S-adenosylmethionine hydrolase